MITDLDLDKLIALHPDRRTLCRMVEMLATAGLPRTADGVAIILGMNLYARIQMNEEPSAYEVVPCGFVSMHEEDEGGVIRTADGDEYPVGYQDCYSTRDAALAAAIRSTT